MLFPLSPEMFLYTSYVLLTVFGLGITASFYLLFSYVGISTQPSNSKRKKRHPVSVVLYSRNNCISIKENLPYYFNQDYPEFEVIIINDRSFDDTEFVLREVVEEYPNLKVVTIPESDYTHFGKKFALTLGIKGASYEKVLISDITCRPISKKWISEMQKNFDENHTIVLGITTPKEARGLANKWIRYDSFLNTLNYITSAQKGNPYRGSSKNIGYEKSFFLKGKGFANLIHITGDDDLFATLHSNSQNTMVSTAFDTIIINEQDKSVSDLRKEKQAYFKARQQYKNSTKNLFYYQNLFSFLFYYSAIPLLILNIYPSVVLSLSALYIVIRLIILRSKLSVLNYPNLLTATLFFDFIYPISNFTLKAVSLIKRKH